MDYKSSNINIAEIMAGMEEMMSRHYAAYSDKFPEYKDFWLKISSEETDHASWIRDLSSKSKDGRVVFNEKRFNGESLWELSGRLESMLAAFREKSKSIKEALSNSIIVESLLLEKHCFEVFKTDDPQLKEVLTRLDNSTKEHRSRLEQAIKSL